MNAILLILLGLALAIWLIAKAVRGEQGRGSESKLMKLQIDEADIRRHIANLKRAEQKRRAQLRDSLDKAIGDFSVSRINCGQFEKRVILLGFNRAVAYAIVQSLLNWGAPFNGGGNMTQTATHGGPQGKGYSGVAAAGQLWETLGWLRKAFNDNQEAYVGPYKTRFGGFYGEILVEKPVNKAGAVTYKVYIKDPPEAFKSHPKSMCFFDKENGLYFINVVGSPQSVDQCINYVITELDKCHTVYAH